MDSVRKMLQSETDDLSQEVQKLRSLLHFDMSPQCTRVNLCAMVIPAFNKESLITSMYKPIRKIVFIMLVYETTL